ncbi:DUF1697 domain-containing protein [Brevibacterium daeguense]|uniref:DUF1697 domain-containing protein n=1 Tax=Brevibacterium daeguense TaxID=909936 RepID=A0ABP8EGF9_9MICO|nr:DUF1697 domain-containing protein [Brevibacterium daeguense]
MRFAAFLRGINVGGRHKLPMAEVRDVLSALGARDVATYIQSGNIVFSDEDGGPRSAGRPPAAGRPVATGHPPAEGSAEDWADAIALALEAHAGFAVPARVLAGADLVAARDACPYAPEDPRFCHLVFLPEAPSQEVVVELRGLADGTDTELTVEGRTAYLLTPGGLSKSKSAERILGRLGGTARNLRTVDEVARRL